MGCNARKTNKPTHIIKRLTSIEIKLNFFRRTFGYALSGHQRNEGILEELKVEPGDEKPSIYKSNSLHVTRKTSGPLMVAQWFKVLCYKSEGRWLASRWCHWNFSLTYSFRSHYGPGVDSASNRKEYQEHFLGVKAAGA
jgi:hypothetical protein